MRILVLNADYPRFLAWFYRRQAELESASYATQPACLASDFYSKTSPRGPPRAEIHVNNPWLQAAWAREHGMAFEAPRAPGAIGRKAPPATSVSARIAQFAGCANLVLQWARGSTGSCWQ